MKKERVEEIVEKLDNISDELYRGNLNIGMAEINLVIQDISDISMMMSEEERSELMTEALSPLLEAMQGKDAVYMADIIKYELADRIRNYL